MSRLAETFARLKKEDRAAFVPFITAGDPDMETSFAILEKLPGAGADVIELGMPFSDPMADGPAVQASSMRALRAGGRHMDVVGPRSGSAGAHHAGDEQDGNGVTDHHAAPPGPNTTQAATATTATRLVGRNTFQPRRISWS